MKSILLLISAVLTYAANSQQITVAPGNEIDFKGFKSRVVKIKNTKPVGRNFSPATVRVLDLRFDSSIIGFINKTTPSEKRMILRDGTGPGIAQFLKKILKSSAAADASEIELVAVIQKLWLSDDLFIAASEPIRKNDVAQMGVVIQVAYFLKRNDACVPLLKFDSTFTGPYSVNSYGGQYLALALTKSIDELRNLDANRAFVSGKKYSLAYIEALYKTRFAYPVLSAKPQKGVYLNFEEFRKNSPSIKDFTIKSDFKTDNLYYTDESGRDVLRRDMFAVSDGDDFYVWCSDNFYKLYRSGNTFNFYGSRHYYHKSTSRFIDPLFVPHYFLSGVAGFSTVTYANPKAGINADMKKKMYYFQLDMDTGGFY